MEGVYLSRGKTMEQIIAERAVKTQKDAEPIAIEFSVGFAREAMDHMRDREDLIVDLGMSLSFLEETLRFYDASPCSAAEISSLLGLVRTAVFAVQEKGEQSHRQIENAIRAAVTTALQEEAAE